MLWQFPVRRGPEGQAAATAQEEYFDRWQAIFSVLPYESNLLHQVTPDYRAWAEALVGRPESIPQYVRGLAWVAATAGKPHREGRGQSRRAPAWRKQQVAV